MLWCFLVVLGVLFFVVVVVLFITVLYSAWLTDFWMYYPIESDPIL